MLRGAIVPELGWTFPVMVAAQLVHAFNCRSERWSLFQLGVGTNRPLLWAFLFSCAMQIVVLIVPAVSPIFKIASLPTEDWWLMGAMGMLPFVIMEGVKWLRQRCFAVGRCQARLLE